MAIKFDDALRAYVGIRDNISAEEKKFKEWKKDQKASLEKLEMFFKKACLEQGTDSITAGGHTAFTTKKDTVAIEDKVLFRTEMAGIMETEISKSLFELHLPELDMEARTVVIKSLSESKAFDLCTINANKNNCKSYMADHEGIMPAGIRYAAESVIQVRRGSSK